MSTFQKRTFLLLVDETDDNKNELVKQILQSPLEFAEEIIKALFNHKLGAFKNKLDEIKMFAAGITQSESIKDEYKFAGYYAYMFAFHQYFHSSFRARQGKILEKMMQYLLKDYLSCDTVPTTIKERKEILTKAFGKEIKKKGDIDAFAMKGTHIVAMQIRSRDDTGGTTAKGSLVSYLKKMLELNREPTQEILYLISIWVVGDSNQKRSTIYEIYDIIKDNIDSIDRETFEESIDTSIEIKKNIKIQMTYGTEEMMQALCQWFGIDYDEVKDEVANLINRLAIWDDLWLAYSVANLELQLEKTKGISNIDLLNEKWDKLGLSFDFSSYENLVISIDNATNEIAHKWTEDTIPFSALSDELCYIRDLLFLKASYEKSKKVKNKNKRKK